MTFKISGDTIRTVYSDAVDLDSMGDVRVKRASHVEYNHRRKAWEVRWAGKQAVAYRNKSRAACIDWEVAKLEGRLAR